MSDPRVTIVTPSFQQGAYIGATIESVLGQTFQDIQYLVIDGGSSDETLNVLRGIRDTRLSWTSEADRGQSHAINKGMEKARGEFLSYLNSDDLLMPESVAEVVEFFNMNPDVDLITRDCLVIDENGRTTGVQYGGPIDVKALLTGASTPQQPGTFWRRSVLEQVGLFDEDRHYVMDYDFWVRVALAGFKGQYIPGIGAAFRIHSTSKSGIGNGFLQDKRAVFAKVFSRPDLPNEVLALQEDAYAFVDWKELKHDWVHGQRKAIRPRLRQFIAGKKRTRRVLAAAMYIDSFLATPLTSILSNAVRTITGKDAFA